MNLLDLSGWSLEAVVAPLIESAAAITMAGTHMATVADRLADLTGLGEALFGAMLLGGGTSLAGIVTSLTTAYQSYPELAISNAIYAVAESAIALANRTGLTATVIGASSRPS